MTPLYAGDQLDQYRLESLVASVPEWPASSAPRTLRDGTTAAIKVPHPQAECDPIFHERFRREIEIGCSPPAPRHPQDLPDARHQSRLYMAMEWLDGRLLRQVLARMAHCPSNAPSQSCMQILAALHHMHNHGMVHRDLKPENIMLDADDHIKIIDFGIASCGRCPPPHLRQALAGHGKPRLHLARAGEKQTWRRA